MKKSFSVGSLKTGGIIHIIRDDDGVVNAIYDYLKLSLEKDGLYVPDILVMNFAKQQLQKMKKDFSDKGIPESFQKILACHTKGEVEKLASSLTISHEDFSTFVFNCAQVGLAHEIKTFQYIADHLQPTEEERKAFYTFPIGAIDGLASKYLKKITNQFKTRKNVVAHLFVGETDWHCFYFSYDDVFGTKMSGENHWKYGDHIHYISSLFGRHISKERVWEELDNKKYSLPSIHIKYNKT